MPRAAAERDPPMYTELFIAHRAILADPATGVMVTYDPVADLDAWRGAW
jgi:hypothetical protein